MTRTIPSSWLSRLPAGFGAVVLCLSACVVVQAIASSDESGQTGREITNGLRVAEIQGDDTLSNVLHFIDADQQENKTEAPSKKRKFADLLKDKALRDRSGANGTSLESSEITELPETIVGSTNASQSDDSPVDTPLSWLAVELQRFCQADSLDLRGPESTVDVYGARDEIEAVLLTTTTRRFQSGTPGPDHLTITFWTPSPDAQAWKETTIHASEFRQTLLEANPETETSAITTQSSIWPWTTRPCPTLSVTINGQLRSAPTNE
ncbi:MAG: hypothetical protein U0996_11120 [Planctomycetaceae bacterium]